MVLFNDINYFWKIGFFLFLKIKEVDREVIGLIKNL